MLSVMLWTGVVIGGSVVYMALGGADSTNSNTNDEVNKCFINRSKNNEEITLMRWNLK